MSQLFEVDGEGMAIRPLDMETGFWRPQGDSSLEVVMCKPAGYAEVWYGSITGSKIELATDAVVRTASAEDYSAGQRLYGSVAGEPVVDLRQGRVRAPSAVLHVGPAAPRLRAEAGVPRQPFRAFLRLQTDGKKCVDGSAEPTMSAVVAQSAGCRCGLALRRPDA